MDAPRARKLVAARRERRHLTRAMRRLLHAFVDTEIQRLHAVRHLDAVLTLLDPKGYMAPAEMAAFGQARQFVRDLDE